MLAEIVRDTAFMAFALWFGIRLGRYRSLSLGDDRLKPKTATMRYEKNRCGAGCAFGVDACLGG